MVAAELDRLQQALAVLGIAAAELRHIVGDASRRVYYRVFLPSGSAVAAVYPEGAEAQVARDAAVQRWGCARGLPIPRLLGCTAQVTVSADLGEEDLAAAIAARGEGALAGALETLMAFQTCAWHDAPTPPFDAAFFRRELAVFEEHAAAAAGRPGTSTVSAFLDDLVKRLEHHPYRLTHRDFHANNLFVHDGAVWAVDYQDMRGGPDTYDAVSLLRERAGGEALASDRRWPEQAARRLAWEPEWRRRYLECAAQRGLKVIGTFLRLIAAGRQEYRRFLPCVRRHAREALVELGAPGELIDLASGA